jgi:hypothetical protein
MISYVRIRSVRLYEETARKLQVCHKSESERIRMDSIAPGNKASVGSGENCRTLDEGKG